MILNPAPAPTRMPDELFLVDAICPNETEARAITGVAGDGGGGAWAEWLSRRGAGLAIVTLGARGVVYCEPGGAPVFLPPFHVRAVDSTAAGDAFAGALAVALS